MIRYCLLLDNDCHWYLVPSARKSEFDTLLGKADTDDKWDQFENTFGSMRINGPHDLTFTQPCNGDGETLETK